MAAAAATRSSPRSHLKIDLPERHNRSRSNDCVKSSTPTSSLELFTSMSVYAGDVVRFKPTLSASASRFFSNLRVSSVFSAAQFVKQKLPDLLRSYVDADLGGNQEGGFQDIAIEVLHLLLSHLLFGQKGASGVGQEQIDAFLKTLCRGIFSCCCCCCCCLFVSCMF